MTSSTQPFFSALLEDRPDLDVVILPPAAGPVLPPATPDQAATARQVVDGVAAAAAAWLPGAPVDCDWAETDAGRRRVARLSGRAPDRLLGDLDAVLRAADWRVRRSRAAYERLVAARDGVEVVVTYAAGGIATFTVLGPEIGAEIGGRR